MDGYIEIRGQLITRRFILYIIIIIFLSKLCNTISLSN